MSNRSNFSHPQDDLGITLSPPLGTENIAPRRPEPIIEPTAGLPTPSTAAVDQRAGQDNQTIDALSGGGRWLLLVVGTAALAACTGLGLMTWLR